jgi:hypothetical protein
MRLWSIHPKYLDSRGLVALWREALLAQAALRGKTKGYTRHPQLERFKRHSAPLNAIAHYLEAVYGEAKARGYEFDRRRLGSPGARVVIAVSRGQLLYEWTHLLRKLRRRSPSLWRELASARRPQAHPLFRVCSGAVAPWERSGSGAPGKSKARSIGARPAPPGPTDAQSRSSRRGGRGRRRPAGS